MEEKVISDWEMEKSRLGSRLTNYRLPDTTTKYSLPDSIWVHSQPNRTSVSPTEVRYELVSRVDNLQSQKLTKEHWGSAKTIFLTSTQGEPVRRRPSAEWGSESHSDEELADKVEQESYASNGGRRCHLRNRTPPDDFQIDSMYCWPMKGSRKASRKLTKISTTTRTTHWIPCKMRWVTCTRTTRTNWQSCQKGKGHSRTSGFTN